MTSAAEVTTFRVGGELASYHQAKTESELISFLQEFPDALLIGGGSNLLFADHEIQRPIIQVLTKGIQVSSDACSGATWVVAAGETWESFVNESLQNGSAGLETLSGIPGSVGAAPIQNIGAYGREINASIANVRVWDRVDQEIRTYAAADCEFAYRSSRFKKASNRFAILDVTFQLREGQMSDEIRYQELADELGVKVGDRAPTDAVRKAVLAIRSRKGMIIEESNRNSFSAGSFFLNPRIPASKVPQGAPHWVEENGLVKVSAAWLIENSGTKKGERLAGAGISTQHVLAICNADSASGNDIVHLARLVQERVKKTFDIDLHAEVQLVDLSL